MILNGVFHCLGALKAGPSVSAFGICIEVEIILPK